MSSIYIVGMRGFLSTNLKHSYAGALFCLFLYFILSTKKYICKSADCIYLLFLKYSMRL